jgi:hypothetical protein
MARRVYALQEGRRGRIRWYAIRRRKVRELGLFIALSAFAITCAPNVASAETILFVGNSFIYGAGSPVKRYGADSVTDLNDAGFGGVPALFEAFTSEAGLDYEVSLAAVGGTGLDFHYAEQLPLLDSQWDHVVLSGSSMLDSARPGDPATLVKYAGLLAEVFRRRNPAVRIWLNATWSRADQTWLRDGHWYGKPISAMALDVRAGCDLAAARSGLIEAVIPVGQAWTRAMQMGIADPNPYDGLAFGKVDLWTYDQYHASAHGYYLEALVMFGIITGRDPRVLGEREMAADDLGISPAHAKALQRAAHAELAAQSAGS